MKSNQTKEELCLKCMECCKAMTFPFTISNTPGVLNRVTQFFLVRGCRVIHDGRLVYVKVPYPCPHLSDKGCLIYEARPEACRIYNGQKDPGMEGKCLWKELDDV